MTSQLSVNRNNMIKHISIYYKTYTYLYRLYNVVIIIVLEFGIRLNTLSELINVSWKLKNRSTDIPI